MAELLLLGLQAALVNNLVLTYFLGVCPFLGVSRRLEMAFGMGAAVTFVTTIAGMSTFAIRRWVLAPLGLGILEYVTYIAVIAATVQLVELYVRRAFPALYRAFGIYLPMITSNCAVLGVCLLIGLRGYREPLEVLTFSLFSGLGFTLALVLMAGIREELELADVPAPFQGPAITLLVAAILALAFMGFSGLGATG